MANVPSATTITEVNGRHSIRVRGIIAGGQGRPPLREKEKRRAGCTGGHPLRVRCVMRAADSRHYGCQQRADRVVRPYDNGG